MPSIYLSIYLHTFLALCIVAWRMEPARAGTLIPWCFFLFISVSGSLHNQLQISAQVSMVQHHLCAKGLPTHKHFNTQQNAGGLALYYNYRLLLQIWNTLTHCVTSQLGAKQCICSLLIGHNGSLLKCYFPICRVLGMWCASHGKTQKGFRCFIIMTVSTIGDVLHHLGSRFVCVTLRPTGT